MDYTTDNRWSPGASGATVPDNAPAVYSARWIDQGDRPADVVPDRQGFAYDDAADREALITLMSAADLRVLHHQLPRDASNIHVVHRPDFVVVMRRAGGYVYVDAWLTPGVEDDEYPDFSDDFVVHTFTVTITAPIDAYHQGDMRADIERAIAKVVDGTVEVRWSNFDH